MCLSHEITSLSFIPPAAEQSPSKDDCKASSAWADVQDWRNAIDFDLDTCNFGYDGDFLALDASEFGDADFDPYATEVNSSVESSFSTPQSEEIKTEAPSHVNSWHCESDTEDVSHTPSTEADENSTGNATYVRLPKWKRRNAVKHLEGERNRRAKRKNRVLTLKQFLPKMKGKVTTNDLLNATLAKVRELRAKEAGAKKARDVDFREALRSSNLMASVAVDEFNRVIEASESFCNFISWPTEQAIIGQHISCFMHHDDAFKLSMAVEQDRKLTVGKPIASQMIGLARFVRSGPEGYMFLPVDMDVSVSERKSVFTFPLPLC